MRQRGNSLVLGAIISIVLLSGLLGSFRTTYAASKGGFTWWIDSLALTKTDLFLRTEDSLSRRRDSLRKDSILRVEAREDSLLLDTLLTVFKEHNDSIIENDTLYAQTYEIEPRFNTIYYVPDSLARTDTIKYQYYAAFLDTASRRFYRDSLRQAKDSVIFPVLDSMLVADSLMKAKFAFDYWYSHLSKKELKEYLYMEKMKKKIAHQDSVWARKDSLKAVRDSIIKETPRVLEAYIIPDSLKYKRMLVWERDRQFSDIKISEIDTSYNTPFYDLPYYRKDVEAVNLGMPGSALMLDNFFKRKETENAFFYTPYEEWSFSAETLPQVNTKCPYTEFFYSGSPFANKDKEEGNARIWTSTNITPAINMNFMFQNWGGAGVLNNEKTNNRTAFVAVNHVGPKYVLHVGYIFNRIHRNENGGIVDSYWIRDTTVDAREIAVHLSNASSKTSKHTVYLDQSYRIPLSIFSDAARKIFKSKKKKTETDTLVVNTTDSISMLLLDSVYLATLDSAQRAKLDSAKLASDAARAEAEILAQEKAKKAEEEEAAAREKAKANLDASSAYVGHNSELSIFRRTYEDKVSSTTKDNPYEHFYLSPTASSDSMRVLRLDNKIFIRLQPWGREAAVSKLDVGIGDKLLTYYTPVSSQFYLHKPKNTVLNSFYIYAGARGKIKKYVEWDAFAKYTLIGYGFSDLEARGNFKFSFYPFRQRNEPVNIIAKVGTTLATPDFYQQHFFSNHVRWDNNFGKVSTTKIEGGIDIPKWKMNVGVGYALLKNNLYYDSSGVIHQNASPMSVLTVSLEKNFTIWKFHMDNRGLLQFSSNQSVVPLPTFVANIKWYFQFDVVKNVMQLQLGANARYTTQYYAPSYNAVTGQFVNQDKEKYGDCPIFDVFVNVQWVRTCVFIKCTNVGNGSPMKRPDYFSAAGYVYPQRTLRFGIMWPFYIQPKKLHSHSSGAPSMGGRGGGGGLSNAISAVKNGSSGFRR